jgi:hypothetical protein
VVSSIYSPLFFGLKGHSHQIELVSSMNDLGVAAIGRNEGRRLRQCLDSVVGRGYTVVYVDSGSGYAFAEGAQLHGKSPERHFVRQAMGILAWGLPCRSSSSFWCCRAGVPVSCSWPFISSCTGGLLVRNSPGVVGCGWAVVCFLVRQGKVSHAHRSNYLLVPPDHPSLQATYRIKGSDRAYFHHELNSS